MFAKIQQCVFPEAIQPEARTGLTIADAHRNKTNVCSAVMTSPERRRNHFPLRSNGDRT